MTDEAAIDDDVPLGMSQPARQTSQMKAAKEKMCFSRAIGIPLFEVTKNEFKSGECIYGAKSGRLQL